MSWRRFHHSSASSGMWTMGRCSRPKPAPPPPGTPVVVIDEDDGVDDGSPDSEVFIISNTAEVARAAAASNTKKGNSSCSNVINIDDDDEEGNGSNRAGPSTAGTGSAAATTPQWRHFPRNRYGCHSVIDSNKSDLFEGWGSDGDDSSDCEILDDSSGTARKLWESAASRKVMPHDPTEFKDVRATTSTSTAESSIQHGEDVDNLFAAECHQNNNNWEYFSDVYGAKYGPCPSSVPNANGTPTENVSIRKQTEDPSVTASLNPDMDPILEIAPETSLHYDLDETFKPQGYTSYIYVSVNRLFPACSTAGFKDDTNPPISVNTPEKMNEKIPEGISSGKDKLNSHNEITEQKKETCFAPFDGGSIIDQLTKDTVSISRDSCSRQSAGYYNKKASADVTFGNCSVPQKELSDDPEKLGQSVGVQDAPEIQEGIIGSREKHKESVEYKKAEEEEWASRLHQLAIQAEEAKKLRKRKKVEALRLVDMKKRQKRRLEEVRESQRKNEEVIQQKERFQGVVRLELENMENRYIDMASILRALGIPVDDFEVKAAYKQALLKFHPDRVSRNDIYQQVKAEETFKFISRLKEKLML